MRAHSLFTKSLLPSLTLCSLGAVVFALTAQPAAAAYTTFIGSDTGAGPGDARPNSDTAAANFDPAAAAYGPLPFVTFESSPVGSFNTLDVGYGTTITGTDISGNEQSILDSPDYSPEPSIAGYNTTFGGANYLNVEGGTATFTFSTPIDAFGAYFTGVQTTFGSVTLSFNDGSPESETVPALSDSSGGISFVGFIDTGKKISSITVTSGSGGEGDYIGVDDVRFALIPVPEPSSLALLAGAGVLAAGWLTRRGGRKAA